MAGKKREIAKKVVEKTGKATSKTVETVTGSDDGKSLFFLILSLSCFYLILDVFYGDNKLLKMAQSIFGVSSVANPEERNSIWNTKDFGKYPSGNGYGGAGDGGRKAIDKFWEKWYKDNKDNWDDVPDSIKKEYEDWKKSKKSNPYDAEGTDGFGGSGGTH